MQRHRLHLRISLQGKPHEPGLQDISSKMTL